MMHAALPWYYFSSTSRRLRQRIAPSPPWHWWTAGRSTTFPMRWGGCSCVGGVYGKRFPMRYWWVLFPRAARGLLHKLLRLRKDWRQRRPDWSADVVLMGQKHLVLHYYALLAHVAAGAHLGAVHQDRPGAAGAPLVQVDIAELEHAILEAVRLEVADHGGVVLEPEHVGVNNLREGSGEQHASADLGAHRPKPQAEHHGLVEDRHHRLGIYRPDHIEEVPLEDEARPQRVLSRPYPPEEQPLQRPHHEDEGARGREPHERQGHEEEDRPRVDAGEIGCELAPPQHHAQREHREAEAQRLPEQPVRIAPLARVVRERRVGVDHLPARELEGWMAEPRGPTAELVVPRHRAHADQDVVRQLRPRRHYHVVAEEGVLAECRHPAAHRAAVDGGHTQVNPVGEEGLRPDLHELRHRLLDGADLAVVPELHPGKA